MSNEDIPGSFRDSSFRDSTTLSSQAIQQLDGVCGIKPLSACVIETVNLYSEEMVQLSDPSLAQAQMPVFGAIKQGEATVLKG